MNQDKVVVGHAKKCQNCDKEFVIEPDDFSFYEGMKVPAPTWCPSCRMVRRLGWLGYSQYLFKRKCDFTGDNVITCYNADSPHKIFRQDIWWSDKWDPKSYGKDYDFSRPFFEQFKELFESVPLPALQTEYSTLVESDYCNGANNLNNCYLLFGAGENKNCAYGRSVNFCHDSFDITHVQNLELCHENVMVNRSYKVFSSRYCDDCRNIWFSEDLTGCSDCIGCINLRNKQYHIFNEPVSKEEFAKFIGNLDLGSYEKQKNFS